MFDNLLFHWHELLTVITSLLTYEWFFWGTGIIIFYPMMLVFINEISRNLATKNQQLEQFLINIRNILLPLLLLYIILSKIWGFPENNLYLKLTITLFSLLLLYFSLKIINILLFTKNTQLEERVPKLLIDMGSVFLVMLGAVFIISHIWDVDIGKLLAALGMGSIVLGLALKDVLGGLFSGLSLLSSKPFKVGDWIRLEQAEGQVQNIDWRSVSLKTKDNFIIVIPNSILANKELHNFSQPTTHHRVKLQIDIDLQYPPNNVIPLLIETTKKIPAVLGDPEPDAFIVRYNQGESASYEIRYFIEHYKDKDVAFKLLMSHLWYLTQRGAIDFPKDYTPMLHLKADDLSTSKIDTKTLAQQLKQLCVFDINDEGLFALAKQADQITYGKQEVILEKSQVSEVFYIIISGEVSQCLSSTDNQDTQCYLLNKGDFFGFSGMVSYDSEHETVEVVSDVTVIAIEMNAVRKMLQKNPQIADCLESILKAKRGFLE